MTVRKLKEYWRDAEAHSAPVPRGPATSGAAGFERTGEPAKVQSGHPFINGRVEPIIISVGADTSPIEIENLLMKHSTPMVVSPASNGAPRTSCAESRAQNKTPPIGAASANSLVVVFVSEFVVAGARFELATFGL